MLFQVAGRQVGIGGDLIVWLRGGRVLISVGCGVPYSFIFYPVGICYSCVGPPVCRQGAVPGELLVTIRACMWPLT